MSSQATGKVRHSRKPRWERPSARRKAQLGSDTDLITQVRSGGIEFLNIAGSVISTVAPGAAVTNVGFTFAGYDQAWKAVDEVVQERSSACKKTLDKIDIKQILGNILGKGFNVKIPQKLIKPVRLPAGIKQSLEVQGMKIALEVKPTGLLVADDRLWYGADISLETAKPPAKP